MTIQWKSFDHTPEKGWIWVSDYQTVTLCHTTHFLNWPERCVWTEAIIAQPANPIRETHFCESKNYMCYEKDKGGGLFLRNSRDHEEPAKFCPFCGFQSVKS